MSDIDALDAKLPRVVQDDDRVRAEVMARRVGLSPTASETVART